MSDELKKLGEEHLSTILNNPFTRDGLESIFVSMYKIERRNQIVWNCYGIVEFKNGNTAGKHRFDGESFDDVVAQIKNFINNEL